MSSFQHYTAYKPQPFLRTERGTVTLLVSVHLGYRARRQDTCPGLGH
jgi:hypothetical protein